MTCWWKKDTERRREEEEEGGERATRECVRMLSADSSRPEDHTRRDHRACLRPSLPIYPRSGGASKKCVSLYYIFFTRTRFPVCLVASLYQAHERIATSYNRWTSGRGPGSRTGTRHSSLVERERERESFSSNRSALVAIIFHNRFPSAA